MSFPRASAGYGTMAPTLRSPADGASAPMLARAQAPVPESAASESGRLAGTRPQSARDERRLVREAQRGSTEAVEALFRIHWPRAHRAAYLVVHDGAAAEDVAQEAFLAALRSLDRFDRRRPFAPWLYRIVVNRAIDHARARALRREVRADGQEPAAAAEDSADLYSDNLIAALRTLAPERRAVVVLRYVLDFTPGEIAEALDIPRGTVNSRLRRGLDALRACLPPEEDR